MGYDVKCYDLACDFLSDEPSERQMNTEANRDRLAQVIQDAIEAELEALAPASPQEKTP